MKIKIIVVLLLSSIVCKSQNIPSDSAFMKMLDRDVLLPILIDSALKNAPSVKRVDYNIEMLKENVKADKKSFLSGVSFLTSYNYGTSGDLTLGKEVGSVAPTGGFTATKGNRYNVGVNVQVPITFLISRKHTVRASELQVKMAESERDDHVQYSKQEIIRLYQEMKLSLKLVFTSGQAKQSAFVNNDMAEKQFLQANSDLEQFSRLHEMYLKAAMEYDTYVNRFQTSYLQLEAAAGVSLTRLISNVR